MNDPFVLVPRIVAGYPIHKIFDVPTNTVNDRFVFGVIPHPIGILCMLQLNVDGVGGDDSVVLERGGDDVDGDAIGDWGGGDVRGTGGASESGDGVSCVGVGGGGGGNVDEGGGGGGGEEGGVVEGGGVDCDGVCVGGVVGDGGDDDDGDDETALR